MEIKKILTTKLLLFLFVSMLNGCLPDLNRKTKEGAILGAVAGGSLGVCMDNRNRWRGIVLGVTLGAVIGGTTAYIINKASKETATYRKPITYESEDRVQKVYAQLIKSEGNCEWVKVEYYEYGKLVKEEIKEVCL